MNPPRRLRPEDKKVLRNVLRKCKTEDKEWDNPRLLMDLFKAALIEAGKYIHTWTAEEVGRELNDWGKAYRLRWGVARDERRRRFEARGQVMPDPKSDSEEEEAEENEG
ncbi:hypothetical protein BGAL_0258g00160 [Botrytis galanthina]|uniref:Uncharacterized protein n=1 Tax=Botrytis galanthina TaxID=278940 RepID=A0A4S8QSS8_9HELO|nr:hypothetical protein BGAL_0258g00160 [Botrytis galanthina]